MKGLTKRIGVGVMAASLVMSSSLVAFASGGDTPAHAGEGGSTGTGGIEGVVKTDVYTAILPTETTNTTYKYIADPQGLIRKTDAAKYNGAEFGEGTVFFANAGENNTVSYSNTSDAAKIVNQSSKNLSVSVTAKATASTDTDAAALAGSNTFSGTDKEVYLGITDSVTGNTEQALTASGATMTAVLGAAPENAYEYSYDETDGYEYTLKSDVSSFQFAEYSFQITGSANDKATDWTADTALPEVEVTWTVDLTDDAATVETPAQESAPTIKTTTYTATSGSPLAVTVNLGAGDKAAEGVAKVKNLGANSDVPAARYTFSGTTLTFDATFITNNMATISSGDGLSLGVVFDDAANTEVTIKVTATATE